MRDLADIKDVRRSAIAALRPPPRLSLSGWADANFRLSAESSAVAGRWTCLPYQREIMDSMSSPAVTHVSVMKSARVGFTLMVSAAVGFHIEHAPCPILFVEPTVDDVRNFSKETIAPMLRDVPALAAIMFDDAEEVGPKDSGNTILHKRFPGGVLSMVGANSGAGFRRVSRKVVIFDEVDAYPPSAGSDGDPVKLGTKRAEYYWDRKIIAGSTPLVAGHSRIEALFLEGDQRRFFVPCPHCGHMDFLVFTKRPTGGHHMRWPEGRPQDAYFECSGSGCLIEHKDKREMVARGEWRASAPFVDHASFHIWAGYSFSPNSTWADLAKEFVEAKRGGRETLRVFCNTVLGETFKESGDAPDWERLYQLREHYPIGSVPAGVQWLTAGVDVQKDRFVVEVAGWNANRESWSIDAWVIPADTSNEAEWLKLDEVLNREFPSASGSMTVRMLAVDSGYNTQMVYLWARRHIGRVIAIKGVSTARSLIGSPTDVDVNHNGMRITRGCKVWPVGVDIAKAELYGWLRLQPPKIQGGAYPFGFPHFPQLGEDYFKQLTGEHLVSLVKRTGFHTHEWQVIPGRENHYLDARVYARAAVAVLGLDRVAPPAPLPPAAALTVFAAPVVQKPAKPKRQIPDSSFWSNRGKRGGWLKK